MCYRILQYNIMTYSNFIPMQAMPFVSPHWIAGICNDYFGLACNWVHISPLWGPFLSSTSSIEHNFFALYCQDNPCETFCSICSMMNIVQRCNTWLILHYWLLATIRLQVSRTAKCTITDQQDWKCRIFIC